MQAHVGADFPFFFMAIKLPQRKRNYGILHFSQVSAPNQIKEAPRRLLSAFVDSQ